MLGSSRVAAHLVASQEGLSSMSDDDIQIQEILNKNKLKFMR
jgi:hypothetical protein